MQRLVEYTASRCNVPELRDELVTSREEAQAGEQASNAFHGALWMKQRSWWPIILRKPEGSDE